MDVSWTNDQSTLDGGFVIEQESGIMVFGSLGRNQVHPPIHMEFNTPLWAMSNPLCMGFHLCILHWIRWKWWSRSMTKKYNRLSLKNKNILFTFVLCNSPYFYYFLFLSIFVFELTSLQNEFVQLFLNFLYKLYGYVIVSFLC